VTSHRGTDPGTNIYCDQAKKRVEALVAGTKKPHLRDSRGAPSAARKINEDALGAGFQMIKPGPSSGPVDNQRRPRKVRSDEKVKPCLQLDSVG